MPDGNFNSLPIPFKTTTLEQDVATLQQDVSDLEQDVSDLTDDMEDVQDAIANLNSTIGTVLSTSVSDVTVAHASYVSIASLTLPAGTWLVLGNPRFAIANRSSTLPCMSMLSTTADENSTHGKSVITNIVSVATVVSAESSYIFVLAEQTTVYLTVYQANTDSDSITVSAEMQAVRIK